jgi:hypothetical protein
LGPIPNPQSPIPKKFKEIYMHNCKLMKNF